MKWRGVPVVQFTLPKIGTRNYVRADKLEKVLGRGAKLLSAMYLTLVPNTIIANCVVYLPLDDLQQGSSGTEFVGREWFRNMLLTWVDQIGYSRERRDAADRIFDWVYPDGVYVRPHSDLQEMFDVYRVMIVLVG